MIIALKKNYYLKFLAQQQIIKQEEAKLSRERHEEMLKAAKQKNDEDLQRKREVD